MKVLEHIYQNQLGCSHKINQENESIKLVVEINSICLNINHSELSEFIKSTQSILNYHSNCTCPPDLKNKMVIYQAKQTEIRMVLSYNQLNQMHDLLKGTEFKLSMDTILKKYKID